MLTGVLNHAKCALRNAPVGDMSRAIQLAGSHMIYTNEVFVLYSDESDSDFDDPVDSNLNSNNAVHAFHSSLNMFH